MSVSLNVLVDDDTASFLKKQSEQLGRKVEDLAECAITEYCLDLMRKQPKDRRRDA